MKIIIKIVILISLVNITFGQQFTDLYGDYLGQIPPGDTPVVFALGVISKNSLEHSAAIFSSDGNEVYWSSIKLPLDKNKKKIWFMQRINNRWTTPQFIDILRDSTKGVDNPFLSINGQRLYFGMKSKNIAKPGVTPKQWTRYTNGDIWCIDKKGQTWDNPKSISSVINNSNNQGQVTLTKDGTIYYLDYLEGVPQECGIFRSRFQNEEYLTPEALPVSINSIAAQDWTPYIAPDESYLIFSSYRNGGYGQGDLYISFHDVNSDTWSDPINLGQPINTYTQERFPSVSPDGKYLFFTRWTSNNHHDIFWVSADIIDKLKEKYNIKK